MPTPSAPRGLLQLTGIVVDIAQKVALLPRGGEAAAATLSHMGAGGGFNALAAARRAGADAAYGGRLGTGPLADLVRAALAAEGADALQKGAAEVDQGFCTVWVEAGGERAYVYTPGAERTASAADLAALPAADFAFALLGGYMTPDPPGQDVYGDWLAALPRSVCFVFDPTPLAVSLGAGRLGPALARADWISANAAEARALTGEAPARAAARLAAGRDGAIVRDGARGCWLGLRDGTAAHVPGFPVEVVDTTGAGDAHIGAFVAGLLAGRAPLDAARFANAAAALSVTRLGGATGVGRGEIERLLRA